MWTVISNSGLIDDKITPLVDDCIVSQRQIVEVHNAVPLNSPLTTAIQQLWRIVNLLIHFDKYLGVALEAASIFSLSIIRLGPIQ